MASSFYPQPEKQAPATPNDLLDLKPGIGQRTEGFKFEVVDRALAHIGWIKPKMDGPGSISISNNTTGRAFRTMTNTVLREADWRELHTLQDSIKAWHVLEDGTEWPMGVFLVDDEHESPHSQESDLALDLFDWNTELDDSLPYPVGIPGGALLRPWIVALVEEAGIVHYNIYDFQSFADDILNWPAGASRLDVIRKLCELSGMLPPYFDNSGFLTIRPSPPLVLGSGLVYTLGNSRILPDKTTINRRKGKVPNTFLVIGAGGQQSEVYATAYVDPSLEHSKENRGRTITQVFHEQGIGSYNQALEFAQTKAQQDPRQYATASFSSVIDSRHDTFDVVTFLDDVYLEINWTVELRPGGTHGHGVVKRLDVSVT